MQPIDRPFRFTLDFAVVWVLLGVPAFFFIRRVDTDSPWYSQAAELVLLPLFATFVLYGPILLASQIVRSGTRGLFVLRVLLSALLAAVFFAAVLLVTGHGEDSTYLAGTATLVAIAYLEWRLR